MPSVQTQQQSRFAIPSYASGVFETFNIDGSQQLGRVNEPSNDLQPPFLPDIEKSAQLVTLSPANINILVPPFLERDLLPPLPPVDQPRSSRDSDQLHSVPLINRSNFNAKNSPTTFVQFRQNGAAVGLANPTTSPSITTTDSTTTETSSILSTTTEQLDDTTTIIPETTTTITTAPTFVEPLTTTIPTTTTEAPRKTTKLTTKSSTAATTSTTIRTSTTKKPITKSTVTPNSGHPAGRQVLIGFKSAFIQKEQQPTKSEPQLKVPAPIQIDFTSEEVKKILGFQSRPGYAIRPDGTVDAELLPLHSTFNFVAKPTTNVLNSSPSTISTTFAARPSTIQASVFGGNFSFHSVPKTPSVVIVDQPNQNVPNRSTSFAFGSLASTTQPLAPTPPANTLNFVPSLSFNRIDFKPQIFQPQPFAFSPNRPIDKSTTAAPPSPSPLQPVKVPASNSFIFDFNTDRLTTTEYDQPLATTQVPVISRISFGETTIATTEEPTTTELVQTTTYATERSTEPITTTTTIAVPEMDLLPPFGPKNDSILPSNASAPVDELALDLLPPQIFQPTFDLLPPLPTALIPTATTPNATSTPIKNAFLPVLDLNPFLPPFTSPNAQSTQNNGNAIKLASTTTSAPVSSTQNIYKPFRGQVKFTNGDNSKKDANVPNIASSNDRYTGGFGAPIGILSPQYTQSN